MNLILDGRCISQTSNGELRALLMAGKYRIFQINGMNVVDASSFLTEARRVLPQDPPLGSILKWDGFTDSLFGGLEQLGESKVAILWEHADSMLKSGLPDLLNAVISFQDVIRNVADPRTNLSKIVELKLFLIGDGPNFHSL